MWIPAVTVLGFLGVSLPPCSMSSSSSCCMERPHTQWKLPELWLLRSPFKISIAPRDQKESSVFPNHESMTIIFPAGAGMDGEGGGYHARVATRVAAFMMTTHSPGFLSSGCAAQICGSTAIVHLRYPARLRRRMLETLATLIHGSIPDEIFVDALNQEKQRARQLLCPCLGDSPCPVIQQAIFQGIEAFDPLPNGATRRGNRLFLHRVNVESCRRWMKKCWASAWIHIDLHFTEVHRKNRHIIFSDLESGLGQLTPSGPIISRPLNPPIFFPIMPHPSPVKPGEAWTLVEISARSPNSGTPTPQYGEERVSVHRQTFSAGTEIAEALLQRRSARLIPPEKSGMRFCGSSPANQLSLTDRYSATLHSPWLGQESRMSRRLFLYLREGIVFYSWK